MRGEGLGVRGESEGLGARGERAMGGGVNSGYP